MAETVNALAKQSVEERNQVTRAIVHVDEQGRKSIAIPAGLSATYNVLAPTAVITQEDPFFAPGFTVVTLDTDVDNGADFYKLQGKLAPTKVALQKLGDAAGVSFDPDKSHGIKGNIETVTLPSGKQMRVDSYTYHAVGYIRKGDGTLKTLTADEEWQPVIALMEIETSASKGPYGKKPGSAEFFERVEKDFLFSARKRAQMIRSKAMNGVLRQALSIKQAYSNAEAAKPFLVISHNWSPDVSDPETARIIASLVGADTAALYGTREDAPTALPDFVDAESDDEPEGEPPQFDAPAEGAVPSEPISEDGEVLDGGEAVEESLLTDAQQTRLMEIGGMELTSGPHAGQTLASVWSADPDYFDRTRAWFAREQAKLNEAQMAAFEAIVEFHELVKRNGGEAL